MNLFRAVGILETRVIWGSLGQNVRVLLTKEEPSSHNESPLWLSWGGEPEWCSLLLFLAFITTVGGRGCKKNRGLIKDPLFDCDRFGQIAGLVHVVSHGRGKVVGQKLEGDNGKKRS